MRVKFPIIIIFLLFIKPGAIGAETIYLSVAASMTDVFNELISDFSITNKKYTIRPNYASSGSLAKQINQGAPADLYVSANPKWMKYLVKKRLISERTNTLFAYNELVFIGRRSREINNISDIQRLDRIALGNPITVPAGLYAKEAMTNAKIFTSIAKGGKFVLSKDVRQALLYADRGEVGGSFVYRTDAQLAKHAVVLFIVPADLYTRISYPIALTTMGEQKEGAKFFYNYVKSEKAKKILTRFGFEPVQ